MSVLYRYELRDSTKELVVTGQLSREEALELGQQIEIAGHIATITSIQATGDRSGISLVILEH